MPSPGWRREAIVALRTLFAWFDATDGLGQPNVGASVPGVNRRVADNLAAVFPDRSQRERERLALETLRAYTRDVVDFLRAVHAPQEEIERRK